MRRHLLPSAAALRGWKKRAFAWLLREWLLVAILALALAVRGIWFGSHPGGFNQDEASTAYDAWAILRYGVDRHGFAYPLHFVSWGSGMYALPAYLSWPFILLFGPGVIAGRMVNLVAGMLSVAGVFSLARRMGGREAGLAAAFLLAITPWHVMVSRWGLDSNLLPAMFLLGVLLLEHGRTRPRWLIAAGVTFGLCLYCYGTAYLVVPAFLLPALLYLRWRGGLSTDHALACGAAFAAVALPVVLFLFMNAHQLPSIRTPVMSIPLLTGVPRYQTQSAIFTPQFMKRSQDNLRRFREMLGRQEDGLMWNAIPGQGMVYSWGMLVALLGLAAVFARVPQALRRYDPAMLLLLWFGAGLLLAAAVTPNINRLNVWIPTLVLLAALGMDVLRRHVRSLFLGLTGAYLVFFAGFCATYFGPWYRAAIAHEFHAGLLPALEAAMRVPGTICVSDRVNMPYVYALLAERSDPREFARTVRYGNPGAEFQQVVSYGRFVFGMQYCKWRDTIAAYVIHTNEDPGVPVRRVRRYEEFDVAMPGP